MNEFDEIKNNAGDVENRDARAAENNQGSAAEQSYSYKSDQIIQDSVYSQQSGSDVGQQNGDQYSQQYTYQSRQSDYTQPTYPYNSYSQNGYTSQTQTAPVYASHEAVAAKKKEHRPVTLGKVIICMLIAAIVASVASVAAMRVFMSDSNGTLQNNTTNKTNIITSNVEMSTVEAVAKTVTPSVVCIEVNMNVKNNSYYSFFGNYGNPQNSQSTSYGSGVVYSTDGYIITNYHVISSVYSSNVTDASIKVYLDNDSENGIDATIIGYNSAADLAVLKIEKTGLTAVEIGDSSKLALGQTVIAIGNPGGIQYAGSVTSGIISGLDRQISVDSVTMSLIQTDAAINPGNSGGALVDASGRLVGVPNVKISADGYEGMGFCIPVNTVVDICNDIIENGMSNNQTNGKPYLGVEINRAFTGGAYVAAVTEGGPAEAAGIKSGDIIISFGDTTITAYEDLINAINSRNAGDQVTVGIYRNGSQGSVKVTLGSNG